MTLKTRGAAFHSARDPELESTPTSRHEFADGSVALQHDITRGFLPDEFQSCDCFYAEPPWRRGVKIFNERAGITGSTLRDVVAGIGQFLAQEEFTNQLRPVVLMCSAQDLPLYRDACPEMQQAKPTIISAFKKKAEAMVMTWNVSAALDFTDTESIRRSLLLDHQCVGDFCCGYGHTAVQARSMGKRFVCSDFNARCIGHMKANL